MNRSMCVFAALYAECNQCCVFSLLDDCNRWVCLYCMQFGKVVMWDFAKPIQSKRIKGHGGDGVAFEVDEII